MDGDRSPHSHREEIGVVHTVFPRGRGRRNGAELEAAVVWYHMGHHRDGGAHHSHPYADEVVYDGHSHLGRSNPDEEVLLETARDSGLEDCNHEEDHVYRNRPQGDIHAAPEIASDRDHGTECAPRQQLGSKKYKYPVMSIARGNTYVRSTGDSRSLQLSALELLDGGFEVCSRFEFDEAVDMVSQAQPLNL
jgi:hypothetical protein